MTVNSYAEKRKRDEERRMLWLAGLNVGDRVARMAHSIGGDRAIITTVECFTAKQAVLANGDRFWMKDGCLVGGSGFDRLIPPDSSEVLRALIRMEPGKLIRDVNAIQMEYQRDKKADPMDLAIRIAECAEKSRERIADLQTQLKESLAREGEV